MWLSAQVLDRSSPVCHPLSATQAGTWPLLASVSMLVKWDEQRSLAQAAKGCRGPVWTAGHGLVLQLKRALYGEAATSPEVWDMTPVISGVETKGQELGGRAGLWRRHP